MKPQGRKSVKFHGKIDCHPKSPYVNWWENLTNSSNKRERQIAKKEITMDMIDDHYCTCMTKTLEPKWHKHGCPVREGIKFPILFYYEEGLNTYIPAPETISEMISVEDTLYVNEPYEIEFKRFDMTDEEFDTLPVD